MKLYDIALHSLSRRKSKTIFLIIGLVLAVSSVVTLITVSENVNKIVASDLDEYGANIVISPKSDELAINYGGLNVSGINLSDTQLNNDDINSIKRIKNKDNISIIAPKLLNIISIDNKKVIVTGISIKNELRLKKWWKIVGKPEIQENEVLAGSKIKQKLNLGLNNNIMINGSRFRIAGIIEETGSQDDAMIFMNLDKAQELFNQKGKLSLIEVAALCYDCPIEEIVSQTSNQLPKAEVTAVRQTIESKMSTIQRFEQFSFGLSIVILIISMLIVFTNVNASVNERTAEIGVLKSIGFTGKDIATIFFYEVLIGSLIAGILGYIIGIYVSDLIVPLLGTTSQSGITFNFFTLIAATVLSIIVGLLSSIYPVYRANKLDPTVAFRAL